MSGLRWPIETWFGDNEQYSGLGDNEVRRGVAWHLHVTLVISAHFFLVWVGLHLKKAMALMLPQVVVVLLGAVLPSPQFVAQHVMVIL